MTHKLNCITLNTRGLIDREKRTTIFERCRHQKADIVFLQETHFTNIILKDICVEWCGPGYHSLGASNSRGTSILITKNSNITVLDSKTLNNGRGVLCNI